MPKEIKTITVIGSGNVATHFALALNAAGYRIHEVYSRSFQNGQALANRVRANAVSDFASLSSQADLFLFSIKDDAYEEALSAFPHTDSLIAHTAGSLPMDLLKSRSSRFGVLYPFQTLSKEKKITFEDVPLLYGGSDENVGQQLKAVADRISNKVSFASDEQRKSLHLSAVFACNFVNHMYALAQKIADANDVDFSLLHPLIQETAKKALTGNPSDGQTGPAIRGDQSIIDEHLSRLKNEPKLQDLYKLISDSIGNHRS